MNEVFELALSRGCLLKTKLVDGEAAYWVENTNVTSDLYADLDALIALLQKWPPGGFPLVKSQPTDNQLSLDLSFDPEATLMFMH